MQKVVVTSSNGYVILGDVDPKTKKVHNFSVKGQNANPNTTYTFLSEAESLVNHLTKPKNEKRF